MSRERPFDAGALGLPPADPGPKPSNSKEGAQFFLGYLIKSADAALATDIVTPKDRKRLIRYKILLSDACKYIFEELESFSVDNPELSSLIYSEVWSLLHAASNVGRLSFVSDTAVEYTRALNARGARHGKQSKERPADEVLEKLVELEASGVTLEPTSKCAASLAKELEGTRGASPSNVLRKLKSLFATRQSPPPLLEMED